LGESVSVAKVRQEFGVRQNGEFRVARKEPESAQVQFGGKELKTEVNHAHGAAASTAVNQGNCSGVPLPYASCCAELA
jgi:hypothetical protein